MLEYRSRARDCPRTTTKIASGHTGHGCHMPSARSGNIGVVGVGVPFFFFLGGGGVCPVCPVCPRPVVRGPRSVVYICPHPCPDIYSVVFEAYPPSYGRILILPQWRYRQMFVRYMSGHISKCFVDICGPAL